MQTTEITESNPDVDAESLEWIVAEDEQVEQVSDLDMQWIGTPLFRGGSRTFLVALVFLAVALALATESIAGVTTGPSLVGLESYTLAVEGTSIEIPLWWLSVIPFLVGLIGIAISVRPIVRALRTTYVLTSEKLYVRTRGIRGDGFTKLPLDRVVDTTFHQSSIGRLLSYGTVTFSTFDHTSPEIQCWAIEDPTELHETVLELEASAASPLERKQRVHPSCAVDGRATATGSYQPDPSLARRPTRWGAVVADTQPAFGSRPAHVRVCNLQRRDGLSDRILLHLRATPVHAL